VGAGIEEVLQVGAVLEKLLEVVLVWKRCCWAGGGVRGGRWS
jgi:hypothetical protein